MRGSHNGFLMQITGKRTRKKAYGTWVNPRAEVVQEAAGTQSEITYIEIIQGKVAQLVTLRQIF